jgi:hypothetical protein
MGQYIFLYFSPSSSRFFLTCAFQRSLASICLSWIITIQSMSISYFLKIRWNLSSLQRIGLPSDFLPSCFPHQNHVFTSSAPHNCHVPHQSRSSSFNHLNNIRWLFFGGVHPFEAHHVNTDVRPAVSYNKVLLLSLIYATYFGRVDHPQALKYMAVKSKINSYTCSNLWALTNCTMLYNLYEALEYKHLCISRISLFYVFLFYLVIKILVSVRALCCLMYMWAFVRSAKSIIQEKTIWKLHLLLHPWGTAVILCQA